MLAGFDHGEARLYQTDPSGTYSAWKANSIGRNSKTVREFLEKNYTDEIAASDEQTVDLALRALLEVVESGNKNIEVGVVREHQPLLFLADEDVTAIVNRIEAQKQAEKEKKERQ